ncbi:hypothetical protein LTS03_011740, partial [Exophiala xenobiotica]
IIRKIMLLNARKRTPQQLQQQTRSLLLKMEKGSLPRRMGVTAPGWGLWKTMRDEVWVSLEMRGN